MCTPIYAEKEEESTFGSQVYHMEQALSEEKKVLSFNAKAEEASPTYDRNSSELPSPEQFLRDIENSYNARLSVIQRFESFNDLKQDTYFMLCSLCAEAERPFYNTYKDMEFADRNYTVMCKKYIEGLDKQYDSILIAQSTEKKENPQEELEKAKNQYKEGYTIRSNILSEIQKYFAKKEFEDAENISPNIDIEAIVENARVVNRSVTQEESLAVQNFLAEKGYDFDIPRQDADSDGRGRRSHRRFGENG